MPSCFYWNNSNLKIFSKKLVEHAEQVLATCRCRRLHVTTAESCTGGLIAACLTEVPGASDVFERGFLTYSNEAKAEMLRVPTDLLKEHGAVSDPVARAMAAGALAAARADIAVSATGIAGPGGATPTKPVGLVFIGGAAADGRILTTRHHLHGSRSEIRIASVEAAMTMLSALLGND